MSRASRARRSLDCRDLCRHSPSSSRRCCAGSGSIASCAVENSDLTASMPPSAKPSAWLSQNGSMPGRLRAGSRRCRTAPTPATFMHGFEVPPRRAKRGGLSPRSRLDNDVDPAFGHGRIVRAGLTDRLLPDHRAGDTVRLELIGDDRAARLREILVCFSRPGGTCPCLNDNLASARFPGSLHCVGYDGLRLVGEEGAEFIEKDKEAGTTL